MNKYKLLFDILKPKVGPDPARIIIYNVYCHDNENGQVELWEKMSRIYKKWGIKRYGTECSQNFIYRSFYNRLRQCNVLKN
jgi:hypothetical protein